MKKVLDFIVNSNKFLIAFSVLLIAIRFLSANIDMSDSTLSFFESAEKIFSVTYLIVSILFFSFIIISLLGNSKLYEAIPDIFIKSLSIAIPLFIVGFLIDTILMKELTRAITLGGFVIVVFVVNLYNKNRTSRA
jgi:hypothetical protein